MKLAVECLYRAQGFGGSDAQDASFSRK